MFSRFKQLLHVHVLLIFIAQLYKLHQPPEMVTWQQGLNSVREAFFLLSPSFSLKKEHLQIHLTQRNVDLSISHYRQRDKLSGWHDHEKGHYETLQYNITHVEKKPHCFLFTVASLFYRVNVLAETERLYKRWNSCGDQSSVKRSNWPLTREMR